MEMTQMGTEKSLIPSEMTSCPEKEFLQLNKQKGKK